MKLQHGRMTIQLHQLSDGGSTRSGNSPLSPPLLLLHALGSSAEEWGSDWDGNGAEQELWNGPVYALDFVGHGRSDHVTGRYYYPELFLIDADRALEEIGDRACVVGAGIGAYVATLLAGSRPDRVPAALLRPGRGLVGGGDAPDFDRPPESADRWEAGIRSAALAYRAATDPFVATCEQDIRPIDYVSDFAQAARRLLFSRSDDEGLREDGSLSWWSVAKKSANSESAPADLAAALRLLAA